MVWLFFLVISFYNGADAQECPPGTYLSLNQGCQVCPIGTYGNIGGLTACQECPAGTYGITTGATTETQGCAACLAGKYQNEKGQAACIACSPGSYSETVLQTSCTPCQLGTYQDQPSQTMCLACTIGKYASAPNSSICLSCQPGFYSAFTGQSVCTGCQPGTSQSQAGQALCIDCPVGKFASSANAATCTACPVGQYTDFPRSTACIAAQTPTIELFGQHKAGAKLYLITNAGIHLLFTSANSFYPVEGNIQLNITKGTKILYSKQHYVSGFVFSLNASALPPTKFFGQLKITVKFLGTAKYKAVTKSWDVTFFSAPNKGIHIINNKFQVGNKVTFFGTAKQWRKSNGFKPFSFRGWSNVAPNNITQYCGKPEKKFTIKPGTTGRVVYPFMAVITTNSIKKQNGNWVSPMTSIAILDTRKASGNKAGQGKVLAKFCYNPVLPTLTG